MSGENHIAAQKGEGTHELGVSVVVPAYDEEGSVGRVVEALRHDLAATKWRSEIIVVDDGSSDATAAAAEAAGARVLRHTYNRGYGAALKTGTQHALYDLVCITDADGTYPTDRIPDLLAHWRSSHADMVVGATDRRRSRACSEGRPSPSSTNGTKVARGCFSGGYLRRFA